MRCAADSRTRPPSSRSARRVLPRGTGTWTSATRRSHACMSGSTTPRRSPSSDCRSSTGSAACRCGACTAASWIAAGMDEAAARASLARLQASPRTRVLFVSHGQSGGVTRHVEELGRALEAHAEVLLLQPRPEGLLRLGWQRTGEPLRLHVDAKAEWPRLERLLREIGIDRVHYHHIDGHPREVLELASRLGVPHDVTIHDYFAACPNYHMLDGSGRYCAREPDCGECLSAGPAQWPMSIAEWRAAFGRLLREAQRVIAPS